MKNILTGINKEEIDTSARKTFFVNYDIIDLKYLSFKIMWYKSR